MTVGKQVLGGMTAPAGSPTDRETPIEHLTVVPHSLEPVLPTRLPLAAAVATAALCTAAAPASAAPLSLGGLVGGAAGALMPQQDPTCAAAPTTKPFQLWNDRANYVPAPNGSFEDGFASWKAKGNATITADNEPWRVSGNASDARSVTLAPGASITSTSFCGGLEYPTVRMFGRAATGSHATILLTIRYTGRDALVHSLPLGILHVGERWKPTGITLTGSGIPLFTGSRLGLTITPLIGSIAVDDIYVDPYRRS